MITDLVDSTPLNQRLGDRRFVELLREHNRVVRTRLRQHDGVEFKHTGDGIGSTFFTAGAAVQCALGIRDDIERFNQDREEPLQIRIGLSSGTVINNEGDLFGIAVIEAFRVCDHATDGRILVSPDVPPLVHSAESFSFQPIGERPVGVLDRGGASTKSSPLRRRDFGPDNRDVPAYARNNWREGAQWAVICRISSRRARTSRSPNRCSTTSTYAFTCSSGYGANSIPTTSRTL